MATVAAPLPVLLCFMFNSWLCCLPASKQPMCVMGLARVSRSCVTV